ncbi:choloylglycine hydrolase [Clostridium perfringens]|uniref:choloylglycine hydrolase n=2 Tax=Clostridium perfringens TaxID=1502 RepID=A0AAP7BVZ2_CLOPF|nr:choloylglycine hydrolase [Clostridium perfringens]EDT24121.1 choloylglycine hydrolase [Clostridium perfringens B str. ATCC 3626]EHR0216536.1 choloylglycine hydrolase [Clostridium perfringens]EJT6158821.1 choloylglycine hydrolase [Clostridium perfringens]ELC8361503.1 choloylglycine hydrolase [Clostridium perfringens]ELC8395297.1 choloylglycine hydrolase [Clostridium perfringens]
MCTGLALETKDGLHLFGRNMDIEYSFNQSIIFIPRNFKCVNKSNKKELITKYAVLGMGTIFDDYPTFADGMNEKGLGCAGLNFPVYVSYSKEDIEGKTNIPVYNFLLWVLANFSSVEEVKEALKNANIVDIPISENIPNTTLHWMISDITGKSIVVEQTKEKLNVFDNNIGVLTNSPTFDWHVANLNQYVGLRYNQVPEFKLGDQSLTALGQGTGLVGLPGDFTPASRFIRVAFLRDAMIKNDKDSIDLIEFFHILNNVAMVRGSTRTVEEKSDLTQYTSCMCLEKGIYYYNTYENNQINAIDMNKENLDGNEIKTYKYNKTLSINHVN